MGHHFDTHQLVKGFIKSGIKEAQAEAIINAIAQSREFDLSNLVTKADLKDEIGKLRSEMHEIKADMLKWMFGMQFTAMSLIIAAMKFL